ncbi:unnamed protein product [Cyclocybe aegerita]|uniref:Integrase core domain-containing protein n=1 Tax=Cyclocybe aegerita TaxID=1973307 RepID=A0A8S0W531_CYCAE|nr:unnamed protein product [Cyclocybe aegerita]
MLPTATHYGTMMGSMIVFHAFVDGYLQLVTSICASNNNQAQTVLDLFLAAIHEHGIPSRVHGDTGTENVLVWAYMENLHGPGWGSYIIGSVHNVQIEQLWRNLTAGFGAKWKLFFQQLEVHDHLDPDLDLHIWLLHFLFLDTIDQDTIDWANA